MKKILLTLLLKIAFLIAWIVFVALLWVTFPIWAIAAVCMQDKDIDSQHRMKYFDYQNQNF